MGKSAKRRYSCRNKKEKVCVSEGVTIPKKKLGEKRPLFPRDGSYVRKQENTLEISSEGRRRASFPGEKILQENGSLP